MHQELLWLVSALPVWEGETAAGQLLPLASPHSVFFSLPNYLVCSSTRYLPDRQG